MTRLVLGCLLASALWSCEADIGEPASAKTFAATVQPLTEPLADAPGSALEQGGGIFIAPQGRAVRVRLDGTVSALLSHPANPVAAGKAIAAYPLTATAALVLTDTGLFVAEGGWLVAPPWSASLDGPGLKHVARGRGGIAWLVHASGVFRIEDGALAQLKVAGASLTDIAHFASAPAPNGNPAVWWVKGTKLQYAEQTGPSTYTVQDAEFAAAELKPNVVGLVGLGPSADAPAELWLAVGKKLWRHVNGAFRAVTLKTAASAVSGAGRSLWVRAGTQLLRYDADSRTWFEARGVDGLTSLLASDASGTAWVRQGEVTSTVSASVIPRVLGLFEAQRQIAPAQVLQAVVPASFDISRVTFELAGESVEVDQSTLGDGALKGSRFFTMGGLDAAGLSKPSSFAALKEGWHTLKVTAHLGDGTSGVRTLPFEFRPAGSASLSFAADIKPIADGRCANCHTMGPGRALSTYAEWKAQAPTIVEVVKDQRMPADGPLDPALIERIERWAAGGALP